VNIQSDCLAALVIAIHGCRSVIGYHYIAIELVFLLLLFMLMLWCDAAAAAAAVVVVVVVVVVFVVVVVRYFDLCARKHISSKEREKMKTKVNGGK
jgi:hypothetical protein